MVSSSRAPEALLLLLAFVVPFVVASKPKQDEIWLDASSAGRLARQYPGLTLGECHLNANTAVKFDPGKHTLMVGEGCATFLEGAAVSTHSNAVIMPCDGSPRQQWNLTSGSPVSLVPGANPATRDSCLNVRQTAETMDADGSMVYVSGGCTNYCATEGNTNCGWSWQGGNPSSKLLVGKQSGLCLKVDPPPPPPTSFSTMCCDPSNRGCTSPSKDQPWCDKTKAMAERARILAAQLTLDEQLGIWSPAMPTAPIPRLNLKGYMWDATCIHGPAPYHVVPAPNVTVTAHAINLGATWDLELVAEVSDMTWKEMRAVTQKYYKMLNGTHVIALGCDGGPLANSAHDPRWGRISETYGEDPYLLSRMGTISTREMQQATQSPRHSADTFLATSQTTRHYIGYHGSNLMPLPHINVSARDFQDQYLPGYESFQNPGTAWSGDAGGRAEAIMCSYAAWNGVPSCASPKLLGDVLRTEMRSECLIQSDCCDSITSIWNLHHYTDSLEDAVAAATGAGTQLQYASSPTSGREAMRAAIASGKVSNQTLQDMVVRALLVRFRLGEMDDDNPFGSVAGTEKIALLDSSEHRQLARRTAAESCVLLKNAGGLLPLKHTPTPRSISLVGPFIDAAAEYLHSYSGNPSAIVTPLQAIMSAHPSAILGFERGCPVVNPMTCQPCPIAIQNGNCPKCPSGMAPSHRICPHGCIGARNYTANITRAAALSRQAELTIAVLGLGSEVEAESRDRGAAQTSHHGPFTSDLNFPVVQQELLKALRAVTDKLVLVVVSGGSVTFDETLADAVIWTGYGGEEAGNGLVDVLWGASNKFGKTPMTTYSADYLGQVGPILDYSMTSGVGRTYRYLDTSKSPPLYAFGYGLSFTSFKFAALSVDSNGTDLTVMATVTNEGNRSGSEVAQLYVSLPDGKVPTPKAQLQGFRKVFLQPGASEHLQFRLVPRQLSVAQADGTWKQVPPGKKVRVFVGGHCPLDLRPEQSSNIVEATHVL